MSDAASPITREIKEYLLKQGASLVGFADLTILPEDKRFFMPRGISVALAMTPSIVKGIGLLPTKDYYNEYFQLNSRLDALVEAGADFLVKRGYKAIPQTVKFVEQYETAYSSVLPHKTVATRAGMGWIGKCALLVTEAFGSAQRISSVLTDAPLDCDSPVTQSRCGGCLACTKACPGNAVKGVNWELGLEREAYYDPVKCRETARARARQAYGIDITHCGKCIEVCPITRKYVHSFK